MSKKYYIELANSRRVEDEDYYWTDVHRVWPTHEYRTTVYTKGTRTYEEKERKVRMRFCWFFLRDIWVDSKKIRCIEERTDNMVMWEDYLPEIKDLKDMCESNPALANAYEQFKTTYRLIEEKK